MRSFAFADAPYRGAVKDLVDAVLGGKKAAVGKGRKKQPEESYGEGMRQIAVPVARIEGEMDLKKEVAATLLTYIELRRPELLHVMPSGLRRCFVDLNLEANP